MEKFMSKMEIGLYLPIITRDYKIVKNKAIGDGSCLIHSILWSISRSYRTKTYIEKRKAARSIRNNMAEILFEKDDKGLIVYEKLYNGTLTEFSKGAPETSLENMHTELLSDSYLSYCYLELLSNELDVDIYIIDLKKKDIYITGHETTLYKNRESIVIGFTNKFQSHFEPIGIKIKDENNEEKYYSVFHPSHDFIKVLKNRISSFIKND